MVEFLVLRCYQVECGAFQVTQKKKDTPGGKAAKWTCVCCQSKQSVRTVFARSTSAAECRKVVQQYNMRRGELTEQRLLDEPHSSPSPSPSPSPVESMASSSAALSGDPSTPSLPLWAASMGTRSHQIAPVASRWTKYLHSDSDEDEIDDDPRYTTHHQPGIQKKRTSRDSKPPAAPRDRDKKSRSNAEDFRR